MLGSNVSLLRKRSISDSITVSTASRDNRSDNTGHLNVVLIRSKLLFLHHSLKHYRNTLTNL